MDLLSYNTPGLLFPAISLLMLAFTNRFFGLASLARQLLEKYRETKDELLVAQVKNLRFRISLVRFSQSFGILSLICCTLSIGFISLYNLLAWCLFGASLLFMILSLVYSLLEIHLSTKALKIEIEAALKENLHK
ncbi:DUF2721 domain-containing protein [Leptospira wolffii]|uniref:Uncharacterized protein n=1 Tax=Leptospira wolffii TaxID=409998 RepID=A0A2M9ZH34_9LEPT|nr:DUF2721 domain-containing protein [Leptospira wolffii]PJZ67694.1 hypothetical protein CH371_06755 [Leptospira wolffii]TGK62704.1 DUF2721 domain-containing protein [Leptospira wolffii]TGK73909.1 DUF2721 domain-containing protein [Leptospira wolffii]TGK75064.1 DUF2721 domain-containing protein [Leptospira wolffii]TGL28771.1 DUF2721 domain-containing protein [Leptospira wolffii]